MLAVRLTLRRKESIHIRTDVGMMLLSCRRGLGVLRRFVLPVAKRAASFRKDTSRLSVAPPPPPAAWRSGLDRCQSQLGRSTGQVSRFGFKLDSSCRNVENGLALDSSSRAAWIRNRPFLADFPAGIRVVRGCDGLRDGNSFP